MIAYSLVGTNDLPRAVAFFEALFAEFNAKHVWEGDTGTAWSNGDNAPGVGVIKPFNGLDLSGLVLILLIFLIRDVMWRYIYPNVI